MLKGVDLLALNQASNIEFVDMQYVTDVNYNKNVLFRISNCGSINIAKIRFFRCDMKNADNPMFLSVVKLPYERQFTSVGHGNGEAM